MTRRNLAGTLLVLGMGWTATSLASAQGLYAGFLSPRFGDKTIDAEYVSTGYFEQDVQEQRHKLCMIRHDLDLAIPVHQGERDEWIVAGQVTAFDLHTDAWIPRTRDRLPNTLWDVRLGAGYRYKFDNDWIAGGQIMFGSASDRPFASGDEMLLDATGFLRIPHLEHNAFLFFLNYSNNREFWRHIPLPGFAYQFALGETSYAVAGLPFSVVSWEPVDRLRLEASYFVPRTVHAEIGYRILEPLKLYAGFDWTNDRFFRAHRDDDDDRLFYYEKRVVGGVRWDINDNVWLDVAGGFAFDRFFFEGEDFGDRHDTRLEIDDGPMLKLELGFSV